ARRRGVSGVVRNRAAGHGGGARDARAAACHHRQRRLRLHHPRAADSHREAVNPSTLSPRRSRHKQARSVVMTTTPEKLAAPLARESLSQDEAIASMGRYGYGWADSHIPRARPP